MLKSLTMVCKFLITDHFNSFYGDDFENKIYESMKDTPEKIIQVINNVNANINACERILKEISCITFETK